MSFRKTFIEWEIPKDEVQVGIPVGFEVEFCRDSSFSTPSFRLTTFEDQHRAYEYRFFYSLDNKVTWQQYPFGDQGKAFDDKFHIKLEVNASHASSLVAYYGTKFRKVMGNCEKVTNTYDVNTDNITDMKVGQLTSTVFALGGNTIYKLNSEPKIFPQNISLNVDGDNALGIFVDESRGSLWQINVDSVFLKNTNGEILKKFDLGDEFDIDPSSSSSSSSSSSIDSSSSSSSSIDSSSSSSTSSSSSSSEGYSSSSSISSGSSSSSSTSSLSSSSEGYSSSSSISSGSSSSSLSSSSSIG